MASYDWREFESQTWTRRFPASVRGADTWRSQTAVDAPLTFLREQRLGASVRPLRPCLFVSHRKADVTPALRIAYLACLQGFDYWLDVLDPTINSLPGAGAGNPTSQQQASAIAAVIEMALLNSTHVMAVMTSNTKGSFWVPYEYGRVKEPTPVTVQAACWLHSALIATGLPEYLHLGVVTRTEHDITSWLKAGRQKYGASVAPNTWTHPTPPSL